MAATGFDIALVASRRFHERIFLLDDAKTLWPRPATVSGAEVLEENVWTYVSFGGELPEQGWKIHVSAIPARAEATISTVARICAGTKTDFKYLRSRSMLDLMNSKYAHRGSSGKFVAIYPRDTDLALDLLDQLALALREFPGPYILSDLSWSDDSPVYTRFGGFREMLTSDTESPVPGIRKPDGELVFDRRDSTFYVPEFVQPPERLSARQREVAESAFVTAPFNVDEVVHFSNGGGVYRGTLDSGQACIVKEARPWTASHGSGMDSVDRLHHEYEVLRRCADIPAVVKAFDLVPLWKHWYLIEELVDGVTLDQAIVENRMRLEPEAYHAWAEKVFADVAGALDQIHARGIVVGDVHPRNIMLTPEDQVRIIDLEAAFEVDRKRSFIVGAPGFATADKIGIDVDLHALAALQLRFYNDLPVLAGLDPSSLGRGAALASRMYGANSRQLDEAVKVLGGRPAGQPEISDSLIRSYIAAHATPNRRDLLFPGSARSISGYRGTNFLDGAAGVLWGWHTSGATVPPEWVAWLAEQSWEVRDRRVLGFDGTLGAATVLDLLGHPCGRQLADYAADRWRIFSSDDLDKGLPGALLSFLGFHARSQDATYLPVVEGLIERLPGLAPDPDDVTAVHLLAEAGAATFDHSRIQSGNLLATFDKVLTVQQEKPDSSRYHGLGLRSLAADLIASVVPDEGAVLQESVRALARDCRSDTRSLLHGLGAAALALSGSQQQRDVEARTAIVEQLHARVVQAPEGNAVPAEGLLRFSCDLTAGSAALLVVHSSISSSRNQLSGVFGPHPASS
ncbi:protein kinase domain-containing protein [Paractinoplanes brasiliensis]|uniref:class III lanthionine synthetase LanKC N-terminal domain-containing protein n=1 Tax=Paractinoplanes brasiliensis TaxID=52695 RepID=UPI00105D5BC6|nr:protein kinase [Actinoplanes brasiliensis]